VFSTSRPVLPCPTIDTANIIVKYIAVVFSRHIGRPETIVATPGGRGVQLIIAIRRLVHFLLQQIAADRVDDALAQQVTSDRIRLSLVRMTPVNRRIIVVEWQAGVEPTSSVVFFVGDKMISRRWSLQEKRSDGIDRRRSFRFVGGSDIQTAAV